MVMADVDWFKNYNDRNGHEAGNRLLRELAAILKTSTREEDLVCRYGGEEFLFFLSGIKNVEEACRITERIRKTIEEHYFEFQEYQPRNNLTMSFGLTYFTAENSEALEAFTKMDLKRLANEADKALAEAKGKNAASLGQKEKDASPPKNKVCVYFRKEPSHLRKEALIRQYKEKLVQERRRFERFYTSAPLIYKINRSREVTKTINISLGGIKILTDLKLPLAETLDLTLILGKKACQLKGDIVYSEKAKGELLKYHSGIEFKELTSEDRKILEDYFASIRMKESSPLTH